MKPIVTVICETVGRHYHVSVEEIVARGRSHTPALARAISMYVVRTKLQWSWPEVGKEFDNRDHTTVMSAHKKVLRLLEDARVQAAVQAAERVAEEWRVDDAS